MADALSMIEMYAGTRPDGSSVAEKLQAIVLDDDSVVLARSPAFIKGLAKGDHIRLKPEERAYELIKRSGNLCIRIFAREDIQQLCEDLTPLVEKLGGELDLETDRMLVYSIHVSCGFDNIEKILDDHVGEETGSAWLYGNVYDPLDGETPLNWWRDILAPQ